MKFRNQRARSCQAIVLLFNFRDAVAVCQFAAHLEDEIVRGNNWTEMSASNLLTEYRAKQALNMGISFTTIAAFGENSAVIHYSPTPETDTKINNSSLFLRKFSYEILLYGQCLLAW